MLRPLRFESRQDGSIPCAICCLLWAWGKQCSSASPGMALHAGLPCCDRAAFPRAGQEGGLPGLGACGLTVALPGQGGGAACYRGHGTTLLQAGMGSSGPSVTVWP